MTTNTPDTTRLSDETFSESVETIREAIYLSHTIDMYDGNNAEDAMDRIILSHRTLAAELARVEGERDRLQESLRMTDSALAEARDVLESEGYTGIVRLIDNATHERDEMERAAPSAADRDHAGESGEVGL